MQKGIFERYWWGYAYLLLIAGTVVALDQGTKIWVRDFLTVGEAWAPWEAISDYLVIVHTWNTGMTLGILKGTNGLFIAISEIVCVTILLLFPRLVHQRNIIFIGLGLGLILGGAAGNLIDRVAIGYVTDVFLITNFPVFNLADVSIILGAIVLSLVLIFDQREPEQN